MLGCALLLLVTPRRNNGRDSIETRFVIGPLRSIWRLLLQFVNHLDNAKEMATKLIEADPRHGLLRLLLRIPLILYRIRLGWLLGSRFLLLIHRGRKTGLQHRTVLEVLRSEDHHCYVVASGWGEDSQWFKNIQLSADVEIEVQGSRRKAMAHRVSKQQAAHELRDYAQRHPLAYRKIGSLLFGKRATASPEGFGRLAKTVPIVTFEIKTD
jgi:deazaflavin-dependent oxidoreductase (nitroreductase family)